MSFGRRVLKIINKLEGLPSLLLFTGLMELGSGIKFQWISLYQNLFSFIYIGWTLLPQERATCFRSNRMSNSYPENYVGCNQVCDGEAKNNILETVFGINCKFFWWKSMLPIYLFKAVCHSCVNLLSAFSFQAVLINCSFPQSSNYYQYIITQLKIEMTSLK